MRVSIKDKVKWLRQELFEMFLQAKQGHPGSVLSQVEITAVLYYGDVVKYRRGKPDDPERDIVIVSKGHSTMGLYPILADLDFFSKEEIQKYGTGGGILRIFGNISIPGIEATTGSLGHGQGVGAGFALAAKKDSSKQKTYVIISEGEMYEGSVWETALFASQQKLDNLILILDRNRKIILGDTEELIALSPIDEKWEAFGWSTTEMNGHSTDDLEKTFSRLDYSLAGQPKAVIAHNIKGKGVSFIEGHGPWHHRVPNDDEMELIKEELAS